MYHSFYRLREEPFNLTPDPRFLYLTPKHTEAINHLIYGIRQRKGFICLTGEVGAGKTTLCRTLLNQLGAQFHTALILNPMLSRTQLLRAILDEFGVQTDSRDRLECLGLLNHYLLGVNSAGQDAVVIIDEAQDMPEATLEMTRLLGNLETPSRKLPQIVLVGQPELRARLAQPGLRQLAQRITVRFHLGTMSPNDTREYVRYRLRVAAGMFPDEATFPPAPPGPQWPADIRFDDGALDEIHLQSEGTPRLVNAICDKSLLAGYVYQTALIDRRLVRLAVQELKEAC
jgi:general secretion pathway protein A